jgi:histidine ammonia-lyase
MGLTVELTGNDLTLEMLPAVVFDCAEAALAWGAREKVDASRAVIERAVQSDAAVYGVNTGFGKMASTRISRDEIRALQTNLVRSHACGIGTPLSECETRALMLSGTGAVSPYVMTI